MLSIYKKELYESFGNFTAWAIIGIFGLLGTLFLFFFENDANIFDIGSATLQSYFTLAPWLLMFVIPALSMKTIAEEEQNGTLLWLFSQPVSIKDIVLGKFLSVWSIGILCLLPSLVYLYTIYTLGLPEGNMDMGATLGSYFGVIMLIGAFSTVGLFASSFAKNQIMAYLFGVFLCFLMFFGVEQLASYRLLGKADFFLQNIGFYHHYISFTRGLVDSRDIFYFIFVMMSFITSSVILVAKKKS